MVDLETTDNQKVGVAVGREGDAWYVQTTDLYEGTTLSEGIKEEIKSKRKALRIAKKYVKKYGFQLFEWD